MSKFAYKAISLATASLLAVTVLTACNKPADKAPTTTADTTAAPVAEADGLTTEQFKALAEEGFIYGLPLVMNYAIMNEYAVDPNSGQFKAPCNQRKNE